MSSRAKQKNLHPFRDEKVSRGSTLFDPNGST